MRRLVLVCLAACSAPAAPHLNNRAPPAKPTLELAAIGGEVVRFVTVSERGIVTTRRVAVKDFSPELHNVAWHGRSLLLLKPDGSITAIEHGRTRTMPALPESTWTIPQPQGAEQVGLQYVLDVRGDEIWIGGCQWGHIYDGGACTDWLYARRWPEPVITEVGEEPTKYEVGPSLSYQVPASPNLSLSLVPLADGRNGLQCTRDGKTVVLSDVGGDTTATFERIEWIETEPPLFRARVSAACFNGCTFWVIYEGCAESKTFGAELVELPDRLLAFLLGGTILLRRDGRDLGTIEDAYRIEVVPTR